MDGSGRQLNPSTSIIYTVRDSPRSHMQNVLTSVVPKTLDTHYAEGSLMPVLVMGLIFRFVPQKSPWFLRPFMRFIFSQLEKLLVKPELAKHSELVS